METNIHEMRVENIRLPKYPKRCYHFQYAFHILYQTCSALASLQQNIDHIIRSDIERSRGYLKHIGLR